mmetsp:Transcript_28039/g.39626  ORF Transcript_28039/g.39626 Transcript_28039/m.39626 type:complete len:197 (+) Transcript_28039:58-648(+)
MARSGLSRAIIDAFEDLPEEAAAMFVFVRELTWSVLPLFIGILLLALFLHLLSYIQKRTFPPNSKQLHEMALRLLKKSDEETIREKAESFLRKSIEQNEKYLPSYLSLASLLLYAEERVDEAKIIIDKALQKWPKDEDLKQLEEDVRAIEHNMGHMVRAGGFTAKHLGDLFAFSGPIKPVEERADKRIKKGYSSGR